MGEGCEGGREWEGDVKEGGNGRGCEGGREWEGDVKEGGNGREGM